jgi:hypothetical protein
MELIQVGKDEWVDATKVIRVSPAYTSYAKTEIRLYGCDKAVYSIWPVETVAAAVRGKL